MLDLFELGEFVSYLCGFWLFLFSPRFRTNVLSTWRRRQWFLKVLIPFEVAVSTFCGLLPVLILGWALLDWK